MKWIFTFVFVALMANDIDRIARINELKEEAREAYNAGDYETALQNYRYLVDSMQVSDDKIMLNMANALYQLKDTTSAINAYQSVTGSTDREISSVAHQQMGILSNRTGNYQEALDHFKQALKRNPANEDARYNYELLKKVLDEQKKKEEEEQQQEKQDQEDKKDEDQEDKEEQQDQQQKDQQKQQDEEGEQQDEQEQQQQEQSEEGEEDQEQQQKDSEQTKDGEEEKESRQEKEGTPEEQEERDQQENEARRQEIAERLKDMKISEEKARMILEAMKNNEIQYIQQNKRKATKRKDSSKPDW